MSDQNSTTPDPNEAVPGYQPPATPEPAAPAPGGYQPPSFTPPAQPASGAYQPPASGGYQPPAAPDSLNLPPAADPYRAAGGYNQPPNPGYPEPAGYPPAQSYGQQPGAYPPAGPVGPTGAPLVDWTKRALGGLIDSLDRRPRAMTMIYANPTMADAVAASGRFTLVREFAVGGGRPGRGEAPRDVASVPVNERVAIYESTPGPQTAVPGT